jgi:hypothetical protein
MALILTSCPGTFADIQHRVESTPCAPSTKSQPDSRGLVPGIHVFFAFFAPPQGVDGRDKHGHDVEVALSRVEKSAGMRPESSTGQPWDKPGHDDE